MNPRLCGCTFIRRGLSLNKGMQAAAALGFRHVDAGIGGLHGHLSPLEAAAFPEASAAKVRQAAEHNGVELNECFTLHFGTPINAPEARARSRNRSHFSGLAHFAALAGFRSVMLLPGPTHPQLGRKRSLSLSVEALRPLSDLAQAQGIALHTEVDCDSCANSPEDAEELCERVHGLKLTLDYSHFIFLGHAQEDVERLHRFSGHIHVRQAAPGRIVESATRGCIDYQRVLNSLARSGYTGLFTVEYLACREAEEAGVEAVTETRKMSAVLEDLLSAPQGRKKLWAQAIQQGANS